MFQEFKGSRMACTHSPLICCDLLILMFSTCRKLVLKYFGLSKVLDHLITWTKLIILLRSGLTMSSC